MNVWRLHGKTLVRIHHQCLIQAFNHSIQLHIFIPPFHHEIHLQALHCDKGCVTYFCIFVLYFVFHTRLWSVQYYKQWRKDKLDSGHVQNIQVPPRVSTNVNAEFRGVVLRMDFFSILQRMTALIHIQMTVIV